MLAKAFAILYCYSITNNSVEVFIKSHYFRNDSEDGWWQFLRLCRQAKTKQQLNAVLDLFLTIEERRAIGDRCVIVRELLEGKKTQREIAKDLNVSIAKITRGSNYLKTVDKSLIKFLEKYLLKGKKVCVELIKSLGTYLNKVPPSSSRSGAKSLGRCLL